VTRLRVRQIHVSGFDHGAPDRRVWPANGVEVRRLNLAGGQGHEEGTAGGGTGAPSRRGVVLGSEHTRKRNTQRTP
jgi:hypothetical protein